MKIIRNEYGFVDVDFECEREHCKVCIDWCEENCQNYSSCQQIAEANDYLVDEGC